MKSERNEILFSGIGPSQPKTPEFKKHEGPPTWFSIMEEAFVNYISTDERKQLYGDPEKGATLEQAWRTIGLLSGWSPLCLLATDKPSVSTDAIEKVVKMDSKKLVKTLSEILSRCDASSPMFYYDGRMGHSITLFKYDIKTSRFSYLDPWPGTSLLFKEYNAAGIDAKHIKGNLWSITSAELEKVIVAAFIFQFIWAQYNGEKYYWTFDELKNSDFWSFFHITEKGRFLEKKDRFFEDGVKEITFVELETGNFKSEIELGIRLDHQQRLTEGVLAVKRRWLMDAHGVNLFALDIVRSYIATLIPPPEHQQIKDLITKLSNIMNPSYVQQVLTGKLDNSILQKALLTYLGIEKTFEWTMDFSKINMENYVLDDVILLKIEITINLA